MSALYAMRYLGSVGLGMGAVYIGKGKIVGVDVAGGRYAGSYTENGSRLKGSVTLSMPNGGVLVTGQPVTNGGKLAITLDLPTNFANGQPQQISVGGNPVSVTFEKIGDVP